MKNDEGLTIKNRYMNREELLNSNSELIILLQKRLKAKRWRVQEGETVKLSYIRALIQALQAQNMILKDYELEEMNNRLKTLERLANEKTAPK